MNNISNIYVSGTIPKNEFENTLFGLNCSNFLPGVSCWTPKVWNGVLTTQNSSCCSKTEYFFGTYIDAMLLKMKLGIIEASSYL